MPGTVLSTLQTQWTFTIPYLSFIFILTLPKVKKPKHREFKQIAQGHIGSKSLRQDSNPGKLSPESGPLEMMHLEPLHYVWPQQVLTECRLFLVDAHWKQAQRLVFGGLRTTDRSGWIKPSSAAPMPQFGQVSLEVGVLSFRETGFWFVSSLRTPTMCQALGKQWGTK